VVGFSTNTGADMKSIFLLLTLCSALGASGQGPIPGALCENVVSANQEDFWQKWDAADLVVYAQPTVQENTAMGIIIKARFAPPVITEGFELRTLQVWKGPESYPPITVSTTWDFFIYDCGDPPGYCEYRPESCALVAETGVPQVFFLKFVRFRWETFMAFGTGVYDLGWLETEVGEPVVVEARNWGSIKAQYR
jgi:hypothetical protein